MTATPVNLRIERNEPVLVEVARHGGGVELAPGMRINERRGQVEEAKSGPQRQDQEEGYAVAVGRRPPGNERTDGLVKSDSLDVFGPC